MKGLVDILLWVVAGLSAMGAIYEVFAFLSYKDPVTGAPEYGHSGHLWLAGVAGIITVACIVILFLRHPRVEEEIHVTK
jgi:hypothetical protein